MLRTEDAPSQPTKTYRKDYKQPDFLIKETDLLFEIFDGETFVTSSLTIERNGTHTNPLVLDGRALELLSISLDNSSLEKTDYEISEENLTLHTNKNSFVLTTRVKVTPETNTTFEGLYKGTKEDACYATQCEAEGFRRITYFIDRPDVLSKFKVRIEADKTRNPVLLSNGNNIENGDLEDGRHYAVWEDPFLKPCYLFAVVAGNLDYIADTFTTMSGRQVDLKIYTERGQTEKCHYAMEALKKSMKWDEEKYGREYDLDVFNIVAVDDFNSGAMENKSLNIFNTIYVYAHPRTSTDTDFGNVEGVIAHEYFHNWTGNRVTCRSWFELSLKEGLTVFRDQVFSGDMNSHATQRIFDVNKLRNVQFKEDVSPMAHPIRPESYMEINNFYSPTVYEKGAEVIRMMYNLLGEANYRKGTDLYFDRHDGQAVTCEDFVKAMEDASGVDLSQFRLWYSQAGTPEINARTRYDAANKVFTLTLTQTIPDTSEQTDKQPMHIPVKFALIKEDGSEFVIGENGEKEITLHLKNKEQVFEFNNIDSRPVPSILRGFSAPVKLTTDLSQEDILFLMAKDTDGFNRWDSGQVCFTNLILDLAHSAKDGKDFVMDKSIIDKVAWMIENRAEDKMLLAEALSLPTVSYLHQTANNPYLDIDYIIKARDFVEKALAIRLKNQMQKLYDDNQTTGPYTPDASSIGRRSLKNTALHYLMSADKDTYIQTVFNQYAKANNMTDRFSALGLIIDHDTSEKKQQVLEGFLNEFRNEELVVDKWFSIQATSKLSDVVERVKELYHHDAFTLKNPNRARSLVQAFTTNMAGFHNSNGEGYKFVADIIIEMNALNPQTASRFIASLQNWRQFDPHRQMLMKAQLERIMDTPDLSKNLFEIASRALTPK